jgi:RsiW-degrading membrane proteinase PrsW (M82 family)
VKGLGSVFICGFPIILSCGFQDEMTGRTPSPPSAVRAVGWRSALGWCAGLLLLLGFVDLALDTPPLLFAAAVVPAAACAAAVAGLDRGAHTPRSLLAGMFLWGAVVAPAAAAALNGAVRIWLGALAGDESAQWTAIVGAPFIEETAKAAALLGVALTRRDQVTSVQSGIVYGALIGIGFTMTENLFYFAAAALVGGPSGLAESVYLRAALGGLIHATFTATVGAGVGWGVHRGGPARLVGPLLGLLLAVAQHALWNAFGATWLSRAPCGPGAAGVCELSGRMWYWLVTAPAILLVFVGPGVVTLSRLARSARKTSPGDPR